MATKKPNKKVQDLKVTRSGYVYTGKWKLVKEAKSGDRAYTKMYAKWILDRVSGKDPTDKNNLKTATATTDSDNLNNFVTKKKKKFTRDSWHPVKQNATLSQVRLEVWGENDAGAGPVAKSAYKFGLPRKPVITWSYNEQNGKVTVTITTNAGADNHERYDTMYRTAVKLGNGSENDLQAWKADDATSIQKTYDIGDYAANLAAGQTLDFMCWAYARGINGDNPVKEKAIYNHRVIAMPRPATIGKVTVSSKSSSGSVKVPVTVGSYTSTVQLQRRHGENGNWENVDGAVDNGTCKALYDSVGLADPVDGEYIYYRILSTRDNFSVTGNAVRADALYTALPSSSASNVGIVSVVAGDDGKSAKVIVGWNESTPWTGTEITWSENPDSWESTDEPKSFEALWKDDTSRSQSWGNTMLINVMGLSEGVPTYIRARRFLEAEAGRVYSGYAMAASPVTPVTRPESVSIVAPAYVKRGEDIQVSWSFSGGATQTEYHVHPTGDAKTAYVEGRDSMGAAIIPAERYGNADSISFYVSVGTGGELTDSQSVTVGIRDAPTLAMTAPSTCVAKPYSFTLTSSKSSRVLCTCRLVESDVTRSLPDNDYDQLVGDVVWTAGIAPEWQESNSALTTVIEIPDTADLYDNGKYEITAYAIDQETGLASNTVGGEFTVTWEHQAPSPPDDITLTPDASSASVEITLAAPQGAEEGDYYDLYRGTFDGYELISSNLKFDSVVVDRYAAFSDGSNSYAVCTVTADGDIEWAEYPYSMPSDKMRIDWEDSFVELPWSNKMDNSYAKSYSRSEHLDGTFSGKWRRGVARNGNYSTVVIKAHDGNTVALLSDMANYAGPCYMRTPDGRAFACNIDPTFNGSQASMLEQASLSVSALSLSPQYMPSPEDITAPEDEEE